MAGRQLLQGRRRRPALQGPAGPGEVGQEHHLRRGRTASSSRRTRSRSTASATPAATSSWPPAPTRARLPGLEIDGERVITSDHALTLDRVPASAIVLGGGVIGVEFASAWQLLRRRRDDRRGAAPAGGRRGRGPLQGSWSGRSASAGSTFKTGKPFEKVEHTETGVKATIAGGETVEAELLLVAVGRGPTTADLGYEEQGVNDGPRLRPHRRAAAHQRRRTSTPSATSCPACSSPTAASSRASSSPRRSPGKTPAVIDEAGIPRVTYSDPEVASVGLTEAQGQGACTAPTRSRPTTTTSAATARARSSRPRASSSWSAQKTARSSASTWSAPGSAS